MFCLDDDVLLIGLAAAILLGGFAFGNIGSGVVKPIADDIGDITKPAGNTLQMIPNTVSWIENDINDIGSWIRGIL